MLLSASLTETVTLEIHGRRYSDSPARVALEPGTIVTVRNLHTAGSRVRASIRVAGQPYRGYIPVAAIECP